MRYNFVFVIVKHLNNDQVIHTKNRVERGNVAKQISSYAVVFLLIGLD